MDDSAQGELTRLLKRAMAGDQNAYGPVFSATYDQLKRLAHRRVTNDHNLNTTALVHESFLKLVESGQLVIEDRNHFFNYAGRVMRSIVVDAARARQAQRRGGDQSAATVDPDELAAPDDSKEALAVHAALERLAEHDEQMVRVVELRYFMGMTEAEVAEVLALSDRTVRRVWNRARLWLAETLD